jgi:hypothetical protein
MLISRVPDVPGGGVNCKNFILLPPLWGGNITLASFSIWPRHITPSFRLLTLEDTEAFPVWLQKQGLTPGTLAVLWPEGEALLKDYNARWRGL